MKTSEPGPESGMHEKAMKVDAHESEVIHLLHKLESVLPGISKPESHDLTGLSSSELARIRSELAVSRTLMAADRTLMAWIRTSLSLTGFGFTIYKLLQGFQASGAGLPQGDSPRQIGLFLTGLGAAAMVMGTVEYFHTLRELRHIESVRLLRTPLIMGLVMSFVGLSTFFSIAVKLF